MELQILLFIWILPLQATANLEREYIYVQKDMTWTEALDYCARNNSVISALSNKDLTSIRACNQSTKELWTSSYVYAAPYISMIGCFRNTTATSLNFLSLLKPSILDCQDLCSSSSLFAIMGKKCACLDNINSAVEIADAYLCDVPCEGPFWCGGKDTMNVYSVVEDFFSRRRRLANPDFTSCVSYQCVDNTYIYKDMNCRSENISEAACSTFFSCTFEPGEPCFLFQAKNDELDWTITFGSTGIGPHKAYRGSYFAFVNDSSGAYKQGSRTTFGSNIDFPDFEDIDWCLRFWVYLPNTSDVGRLQVYTEKTGEKLLINNFTNRQNAEWNYAEVDIQVHTNDRIFFESVRGVNGSHFAVDDITLIKGKCRNTHSSVLYMTGEVKCNFEGNKDICFDQDQNDNFDWIIARNEQKIRDQKTGPMSSIDGNYYSYINTSDYKEQKNFKAVLISKFYLTDVNITFSMKYHMYGWDINTLRVYLKNGTMELEIFRRTGNQGEDWLKFSFTKKIEGTWKLFISANKGNGPLGYIAIDDVRIKINRRDLKYDWMNQNERCKHNLGVYAINHQQLPDQPCLSFDFDRWTGIIRPQRRGSANNVLAKHPTKVKIYRNLGGNYEYVWESFNLTFTRRFICERNSSTTKDVCTVINEKESTSLLNPANTPSSNDTLVGVLIASAATILVVIIITLICYKWKKTLQNGKKPNITPVVNENAATYRSNNETILIQSKRPTEHNTLEMEENNQKTHQEDEKRNLHQKKRDELPTQDHDETHYVNNDMVSTNDDLCSGIVENQYESPMMPPDDTHTYSPLIYF